MKNESVLSHNIKLLRKLNKLSQEALANKIGIKRSNVTAYESKNVEPRLRTILDLAKTFNISVKSLISQKLKEGDDYPSYEHDALDTITNKKPVVINNNEDIDIFIDKSIKIRKVLEGFKAFYMFKKNNLSDVSFEKEKLILDIDNFLQLMEHLLTYNESVIKAISNSQEASIAN